MSHDIRPPSTASGYGGDRRPLPGGYGAAGRLPQKIWEASTLLLELVNEVLDMGKLESGEVVLENVPFDLPELIHEITDVLEKQAEERGIVLHREYGRLPHPRLVGSPLHVKRLLMNVLSNAIKYNREKGRVMLDCFELSCTGDKAQICFVCADTGIGMSEEFQKRMFEPFVQENAGARSVYGGTGLGMSITKSLVDKMGGTIGVESKQGVGTTYTITLPLCYRQYRGRRAGAAADRPYRAAWAAGAAGRGQRPEHGDHGVFAERCGHKGDQSRRRTAGGGGLCSLASGRL